MLGFSVKILSLKKHLFRDRQRDSLPKIEPESIRLR